MRRIFIVATLVLLTWGTTYAQRTLPMTLKEMVGRAAVIVHATVTGVETGRDPVTGMPATWVTLRIAENFYGALDDIYTFKQVGGEADGMAYRLAELPQYTRGEEIVLLLSQAHRTTGFTSPVGIGQGKFRVRSLPAPRKKVVEQITPSNILLKESPGSVNGGALSFDQLAGEIRSLVRTEKGGTK